MRISDWSSDVCSSDLISKLSKGHADIDASLSFYSALHTNQRSQHENEAENHGKCVVVQITRLQLPGQSGDAIDQPGRAVDGDPIDHRLITTLPQAPAQAQATRRKPVDPQRIEAALVEQHQVRQDRKRAIRGKRGEIR